jgi:hypothetical protein
MDGWVKAVRHAIADRHRPRKRMAQYSRAPMFKIVKAPEYWFVRSSRTMTAQFCRYTSQGPAVPQNCIRPPKAIRRRDPTRTARPGAKNG